MPHFKRGDVFTAYIPPMQFDNRQSSPPSYILEGHRMLVMLHDSDDKNIPSRSVLVAPITKATSTASRGDMHPTYVQIDKQSHPFLKHDSFVATHQVIPVNREWLGMRPVGKMQAEKMVEIDYGIIRSAGLQNTMMQIAIQYHAERMNEFEKAQHEASASKERDQGYER